MSSRWLKIPTLVLALSSAAGLASCSSSVPVDSVTLSGDERIPVGFTTQLIAIASVSRGRLLHDVSTSATWESSDTSVASVAGGLVKAVSPGVVTIRATRAGASGTLEVAVTDARLTGIDIGPGFTLPAGVGKRLTATGTFSDLTSRDLTTSVTWTTSVPSVASVSEGGGSSGLVTSVAPGAATITATDPGTAIAGSTVVTVSSAQLVSIAITPGRVSVPLGTHQQFTAVGTYTDSTTQDITASVRWSSSIVEVATVATAGAAGVASTTATGTTTITVTDPGTGISISTALTVTAARLTSLAITPPDPSIALGARQQLTATGTYTDSTTRDLTGTVTWGSSDSAVTRFSSTAGSNGVATGAGIGSATIKATDGSSGLSGTTTLTVTAAQLVSIAVTPATPSLPVGLTHQFAATGTYTDSTTHDLTATVNWQSSVPPTASISNAAGSAGLTTALTVGSTVISATDPASGTSGSTTLTVTAARLVSIAVTPAVPSTPLGLSTQFTAIGTYTNASTQDLTGTLTWASSNASVASVSNAPSTKGLAATLSPGTTNVTATDPASGISGSTTLTVTAARLVSVAVTPTAQSVPSGLDVQFTAIGRYTDASTQVLTTTVTWSSSTPAVASISNAAGSQGVATSGVIGTTTITALDPTTHIDAATTLTVTAAQLVSIAITPSSPSVPLGLTRQFIATGTYTNGTTQDLTSTVTWSSSNTSVATISNAASSEGLATTASLGTTTVSAADPATHTSGSTTLTVNAAQLVSIALTPATASVPSGLAQQFTAAGTYTDSTTQDLTTTVSWSSSDITVATISNAAGSNGLATAAVSLSGTATTTIAAAMPVTSPPVIGTATLTVTP